MSHRTFLRLAFALVFGGLAAVLTGSSEPVFVGQCSAAQPIPLDSGPEGKAGKEVQPDKLPPLPEPTRPEKGVLFYKVFLGQKKGAREVWLYLPEKAASEKVPCVLVAPAGSTLFFGKGLDDGIQNEHLPYVRAGFAVIAYALDGNFKKKATAAEDLASARAFRKAEAGLVNARQALEYALAKVPAIDPDRIYTAGHSSAGTVSLLVASQDKRIKGCIAYNGITDVDSALRGWRALLLLQVVTDIGAEPGFWDFIHNSSPLTQVARLRCPVYLFNAKDDRAVPVKESAKFLKELKKTNESVTVDIVEKGGHYEPMIREGIPRAILWLQKLAQKK